MRTKSTSDTCVSVEKMDLHFLLSFHSYQTNNVDHRPQQLRTEIGSNFNAYKEKRERKRS